MDTNNHLIALERELEADLAEARQHIELGRLNAIDELNAHRESLGELCAEAALKIDLLAHDADEDLKRVRARLGELNLLLAIEEIDDLETFDTFRERILEAMKDAELELEDLNRRGEQWGDHEGRINGAWRHLSRQLMLARRHLVNESKFAVCEFEAERAELAAHIEDMRGGAEDEVRGGHGELLGRMGAQIGRFVPALKTVFIRPRPGVPSEPHGRRHD